MAAIEDVNAAMIVLDHAITQFRGVADDIAQKAAVAQMERDQALASYNGVVAERDRAIADLGQYSAIGDQLIALAQRTQGIFP